MKMQIITITPKEPCIDAGFTICRDIYDNCILIDETYCNIELFHDCKSGFVASGFSSLDGPIIQHDLNNVNESIEDFVKEVFSK